MGKKKMVGERRWFWISYTEVAGLDGWLLGKEDDWRERAAG